MSDKPKTLEQAFESFENAFTPPVSLSFNEKLLVEIFWNAAIESRKEIEDELRLEIHHRDEQIESMQSELDKRDALFDELAQLVWDHFLAKDSNGVTGKERNKVETSRAWSKYHRICNKKLTQGNKDENM